MLLSIALLLIAMSSQATPPGDWPRPRQNATFAQHHEVLLNKQGRLELAWAHGWPESVTTGKVATAYPEPPDADLDGDGYVELITGAVSPNELPRLEARTPGLGDRLLWSCTLPAIARAGLPYGHPLYLQAGHFTGKKTPDLYVWAGTPLVRSLVVEGRTGKMIWEKGEIEGIERFWGPSVNLASAWDFDGDGAEDLVFTNPDYYCVLSGSTGAVLHGPSFPPKIFDQPSQGLYSFPALLERTGQRPLVCLAGAHYFVGRGRWEWPAPRPVAGRSARRQRPSPHRRRGRGRGQRDPGVYDGWVLECIEMIFNAKRETRRLQRGSA